MSSLPGELEDCIETGGIHSYFLFEEESIVDEYALNAEQVHDICKMSVLLLLSIESCKRTLCLNHKTLMPQLGPILLKFLKDGKEYKINLYLSGLNTGVITYQRSILE